MARPVLLTGDMSTPENPPPAGGDEPGRGLSGIQRASIVLGGLAVLLIVFVLLRGGDDSGNDSSSAPSTATQTTAGTAGGGAQTTATTQATTTTDDSGSETGSTTDDSTTSDGTTSDDTTATSTTPTVPASQTIDVVNGQPQGGIKTVSFNKGDQVLLKVNSDTADEIHVHGYDLKKDVEKGGSVTFSFKATIEGRFEVELENAGTQIANLEVQP
jgi:copper(I)-binding protein